MRFVLSAILLAVVSSLPPASATEQGGYFVVYVASNGNDANNCGEVDVPCQTIYSALGKVHAGGIIICLSAPHVVVSQTISVSVTIECPGSGVDGALTINLPPSDTRQTVRLRGMTFNGLGGASASVVITSAKSVSLEGVTIVETSNQGVMDQRTAAGRLIIKDSVISRSGGAGVVIAGAAGNTAILDNVVLADNAYGVAVAAGNDANIIRSDISGNSVAGVEADGGSLVIVDGSTISRNNVGIQSGSAIRLSNNNITFNTTAVNGATGTFGNNRFSGNVSEGTALTPVGAGSTDLAQK